MGFLQNFGSKLGRGISFGAKVAQKGLNFGAKVSRTVSNAAGWVAKNGDRVLNLAEVIPGVSSIDGALRGALGAAQGIASSAGKAADLLAVGAGVAGKVADTVEKRVPMANNM